MKNTANQKGDYSVSINGNNVSIGQSRSRRIGREALRIIMRLSKKIGTLEAEIKRLKNNS